MTVTPADRPVTATPRSPEVFADLRMEVDGQRVHVVGDGSALVVHVERPLQLVSTLRQTALPAGAEGVEGLRGLGRAATALRSAGLTVDVRGPEGVLLVRLGERTGTTWGRLITGSDAVRFGSTRGLFDTVTATLPLGRVLAGSVAASVLAVVAARRIRGRSPRA